MDPIITDRLILRNFVRADAADLFAYLHRPSASCFAEMAVADLAAAEATAEARGAKDDEIAVCLAAAGRVIGDVFAMPEPPDTFSVGWNFNPAFGGLGYATEAARALFAHLFGTKNARRLYAFVEVGNRPSQRLCERLGMRLEGVFQEFISFETDAEGRPIWVDTQQFAILRREWEANGGAARL